MVDKWNNFAFRLPAITGLQTLPQQLRQLGDVGGDAPGLVTCQQARPHISVGN